MMNNMTYMKEICEMKTEEQKPRTEEQVSQEQMTVDQRHVRVYDVHAHGSCVCMSNRAYSLMVQMMDEIVDKRTKPPETNSVLNDEDLATFKNHPLYSEFMKEMHMTANYMNANVWRAKAELIKRVMNLPMNQFKPEEFDGDPVFGVEAVSPAGEYDQALFGMMVEIMNDEIEETTIELGHLTYVEEKNPRNYWLSLVRD